MVDNLRAKMLIRIDILNSKDIDLVISTRTGHVSSYRTTFQLTVAPPPRPFIKHNVIIGKSVSVPAHSYIAVPIEHIKLPARNNFIFKPTKGCPIALFASVVNSSFHAVLVRNDSDKPVDLPNKLYINSVTDIEVDRYYHLDNSEEAQELAVKLPK